jgi:hypothetical protein
MDAFAIILAKKGLPAELVKIIRDYSPKCRHCRSRTPFLGGVVKIVTWSGTYMGQRRYHSIYHKKGWVNYPQQASEYVYKTCYSCRADFIHYVAFDSSWASESIKYNGRQWADASITSFSRYDKRLHDIFVEILTSRYPDNLESYLEKYECLANFPRR